jgi:hypothetical protein
VAFRTKRFRLLGCMTLYRTELRATAVLVAVFALFSLAARADLQLGDPPRAPKDVSGLPRQPDSLVSGGFSINPTNREDVRSFYNAVYTASDGVSMNSTANSGACFAGTNSSDFNDAVLRRINWFRAMAGLSANVTFNTVNNSNDMLGALIMSASSVSSGGSLSHTPTNGGIWLCWSSAGSNACNNSNLALGSDGPDSVSGYIQDPGANNTAGGHRRWILYPQTQVMGTGDIPPQGNNYAANAIWVFDGHLFDPRPATRTAYIAWPPPGYVPKQVVYPRWSFAYTNANFTSATITMTSNGLPVSVSKETVQNGFGENTLVWIPMGLDANNFSTVWPFSGGDTVYTVGISNVLFGVNVSNFNYSVTVFDPAVPGAGYFPPIISGPAQPTVGANNAYTFNSVSNATSYQWRYTPRSSFSLTDGAEASLANWTTNSSSTYSIISSSPVASGSFAFQLGHPAPPPNPTPQTMLLNNTVYPLTNTTLQFKSRLEYATSIQVARVQVSTNNGNTWLDVYAQSGSDGPGESVFSTKNISLAAYAGVGIRLRFNYDIGFGSYYSRGDSSTGWHFDDIAITNAEQLIAPVTNAIASTNFQFNPPQVGNYNLEARGVIFTDFALDWGPTKQVVAITSSVPVISVNKITVSNNQTKVDFTLQAGSASTYKLLTALQVTGAWSTDTLAVLSTNSPGSYRFTTTPSGGLRFYRVQTP